MHDQRGIEDLLARARRSYPAATLDVVEEGMRRLTAYQHRWYAEWYLNRLDTVHALGSTELLRETARNAALDTFTEWKAIYVDFSGRLQRAQIDNQ